MTNKEKNHSNCKSLPSVVSELQQTVHWTCTLSTPQAAVLTQNGTGSKYSQSSSSRQQQRRGGSHRHSAAARNRDAAVTSSSSSTVRRTQSAFVATSSKNNDAAFPVDDVKNDDDAPSTNDALEKKVVIKVHDSDNEENRGKISWGIAITQFSQDALEPIN